MSKIQKALDSLQPYVIGIRYLEGTVLVDVVFKEGWAVLDEPKIKKVKGDEGLNYFMVFTEDKNLELDDLLDYIHRVINYNIEREKKHDLLKSKVNELKEIFKKNPLKILERLQFSFAEDDLVPKLEDFDIDDELEEDFEQPIEEPIEEFKETIIDSPEQPITYLDENQKPIELTEEEMELLEEEARAERNRKILANKKSPVSNLSKKVELPPKRKPQPQMVTSNEEYDSDCDCGPNEGCNKCIDGKSL